MPLLFEALVSVPASSTRVLKSSSHFRAAKIHCHVWQALSGKRPAQRFGGHRWRQFEGQLLHLPYLRCGAHSQVTREACRCVITHAASARCALLLMWIDGEVGACRPRWVELG